MRTVWFTADTHFGHRRIPFYARRLFCLDEAERSFVESAPRGSRSDWQPSWASVSRMDDQLIRNINECVGKDDILWHLGDFCWGKGRSSSDFARRYRERINCRNVFLVMGNHDSESVGSVFAECHMYKEIEVQSRTIVLSHYAQSFWNRSHYGSWMLYGHAHGTAEAWLDAAMPGRLSMDVGVDNIAKITGEYRPIRYEEIAGMFSSRKGCQIDGHKSKPPSFASAEIGL